MLDTCLSLQTKQARQISSIAVSNYLNLILLLKTQIGTPMKWAFLSLASMVFAIQKPAPPGGLHRGFAPMTPKKNKPLQTSKRHRYSRKNTRPIRG